jgi:hypothetical protein
MNQPIILCRVKLTPSHRVTGKTRHFHGTEELPTPSQLRVAQYRDDPGFYLFYCNDQGNEITDTYHDSLEHALSQAEWEFGVRPDEWQAESA